ncbi:MAG: triose-phosphate isomerase [Acidobacteriota bacterium]
MTSRTRLVIANWKMNGSLSTLGTWAGGLRRSHDERAWPSTVGVWLAPSFPLIAPARQALTGLPLRVAAQNCHEAERGAFTGEVSVAMLQDCGAQGVIIGHSERRHVFGESDQRIAKKLAAVLDTTLIAILCVGETEPERDASQTNRVLETQLRNGLGDTPRAAFPRVVIAYEPVWAIGTGRVATQDQVAEAHAFVRSVVAGAFGTEIAAECRVVYGGSVDPKNAPALAELDDVDGFLVGGASLDSGSFRQIIDAAGRTGRRG